MPDFDCRDEDAAKTESNLSGSVPAAGTMRLSSCFKNVRKSVHATKFSEQLAKLGIVQQLFEGAKVHRRIDEARCGRLRGDAWLGFKLMVVEVGLTAFDLGGNSMHAWASDKMGSAFLVFVVPSLPKKLSVDPTCHS